MGRECQIDYFDALRNRLQASLLLLLLNLHTAIEWSRDFAVMAAPSRGILDRFGKTVIEAHLWLSAVERLRQLYTYNGNYLRQRTDPLFDGCY